MNNNKIIHLHNKVWSKEKSNGSGEMYRGETGVLWLTPLTSIVSSYHRCRLRREMNWSWSCRACAPSCSASAFSSTTTKFQTTSSKQSPAHACDISVNNDIW